MTSTVKITHFSCHGDSCLIRPHAPTAACGTLGQELTYSKDPTCKKCRMGYWCAERIVRQRP